jgi:homoaconitate hydratase
MPKEIDMGLTLVEKIAARHADGLAPGAVVRAGDFISIRPRHVMTHDNTGAVIPKFKQIGATEIADPAQPVFAIDHDIQNVTPKNLEKYAKIEAFAQEHGIDFYPAGTGISHQVMVEQGYVVPGAMVVASDSHSNLYGAAAAMGTPVVRTDAASIWATGVTWWQVPKVAKVLASLQSMEIQGSTTSSRLPVASAERKDYDLCFGGALEASQRGIK